MVGGRGVIGEDDNFRSEGWKDFDKIDLTPDTNRCTDTYQENNKTLENNGSHTDELTYFKRTDKTPPKNELVGKYQT